MNDKNKKYLGAALGLLVLGASMFVPAAFAETQNLMPGSQGGLKHENLKFFGMKPKRVVASATGTLLVIGEGFLDGICAFGGAEGAYSIALDSGEGASGLSVHSHSLAIGIPTFTSTVLGTTSGALGRGYGCWWPQEPIKFVNGLVGINSASAHTSLYYVHPSSGRNPWAP